MTIANRVLVTGAGGFIGHHLVKRLKVQGYWVRGADIKEPEFEPSPADEFELLDLRGWDSALKATRSMTQVYNLAADMGGIGYITSKLADIARNNVLINTRMLEASRIQGVERFLFSSSACVYAGHKQNEAKALGLREEDAYPADPEPGYGWEKLFSEQLCSYYFHDFGFETRVVRFHNVYGPLGTFEGGREKAPAAICRKVALASDSGHIDVWGDGAQSRSFMYISDCVEGILRVMASDYHGPLNLGTEETVSVDELVEVVCDIAGKNLVKRHDLGKPQGVRGRTSDNTRLRNVLGWEPQIRLLNGLKLTYLWIEQELRRAGRLLQIPAPQLIATLGPDPN
jgi:GDP-D-mannose 3', 5'-epimerase